VAQVPPLPPIPQVPAPPDIIVTSGPDILPPWMVLSGPVIVLSMIALCAAAAIIFYPLMRAIGRRIEGRGGDAELRHEVEELRERLRELEAAQPRMAELEERLDFAERLLAQRREPEQLPRS
jgi:Tfp pilus assembly protein PilO